MTPEDTDRSSDSDECSPVEALAEQYLERLRNGERPRISEYTDAHPELADEIRDVFRTLAMLEDLAPQHNNEDAVNATATVEAPAQLGEYRIVRELGRGGMGVVYEAEHGTMRRRVALKVLHFRATKSDHDLQRFLREARSAGRLHHTNIVPVFEIGSENDVHFYAMQYICGQNLDLVIRDLQRLQQVNGSAGGPAHPTESSSAAQCLLSGRFLKPELNRELSTEEFGEVAHQQQDSTKRQAPEPGAHAPDKNTSDLSNVGGRRENYFHRVARVGLQVAEALAYAHEQGILHRDIKPSNLILDTVGKVWITDFGLARSEGDDLTLTGDIVGTLRYMAPERFRGEADARSDIYSLGLTLYELCTLRYAFDQTDRGQLIRQVTREQAVRPRKINSLIPRDLETIILKCIEREPGGRYRRASEAADDLRLFLDDRPIQARRATLVEQGWRWCRRNPGVAGMVAFISLLLAVIVFGALKFAVDTAELNKDLVRKEWQAEQARRGEQRASLESRYNLYQALYRQAQAERRNELTGRRDHCLEALKQASAILPELDLSQEERERQRILLRNEAVAALGQTGLSIARSRMPAELGTRSIAYDGNYERYAVSRGQIEIRTAGDNRLLRAIPQAHFRATDLIFSHDGRFLATIHRRGSSDPRYVRVWDLLQNRPLLELEIDCHQICFSPQTVAGKPPHLAFLTGQSSAVVCRFSNPEQRNDCNFGFRINGICFIGDETVAVVGDQSAIATWNAVTDQHASFPIAVRAQKIDWCRNRNRVVVGYQSGTVDVFDLGEEFTRVAELKGHIDDVTQISLSPDGDLVASASWDGTTRIWDVRSERELKRLENGSLKTGFSHDSRFLCCEDVQGRVHVYEIARNDPKHTYFSEQPAYRNHSVDFHPVDSDLAALATGFHVEIRDLRTHALVQLVKSERTFVAKFSHDGQRLMTSGRRGLRLWRVTLPDPHAGRSDIVTDARFLTTHDTYHADATPDLSRIVFVDVNGRASVIQADDPDNRTELQTPNVYRVAISPDGRWVVTISAAGRGLIIWSAITGEQIAEILTDASAMLASFSRDGEWLAASNSRGRFLWRVGKWDSEHSSTASSATHGAVAVSPGRNLIVMPRDRFSLELLAGDRLQPLLALDTGGRRQATSARFSSDGNRLAITSQGRFEVWDIPELRRRLRELGLDWTTNTPAGSDKAAR